MLFKKKKKEKELPDDPNTPVKDDTLQKMTKQLYGKNVELSLRNKTLDLLQKLYETSVVSTDSKSFAEKGARLAQDVLELDMMLVFKFDEDENELKTIGASLSDRLHDLCEKHKCSPHKFHISDPVNNPYYKITFTTFHRQTIENLEPLILDQDNPALAQELEKSGFVKTLVIEPLLSQNKVLGVLVFGLNRNYTELARFEQEAMSSLVGVMALGLDKIFLYENLQTANSRLKELDKQKSEFVSLASHQLRGPLTSIKGYISLILEGDFGEISSEIKGALEKVASATSDLALLVGDYLDVSRIELGKMKYNLSTFSLNDLVDEVIGETRPAIEKSQLNLKINIDKLPSNINADRNKIKQVILNLIDNSIKYTPEGDMDISVKRNKDTVTFSVKDTGVGIPKEVLPNLFQKFSRAPKASATNILGTGLGLYVAKKILDEHHGKIWAESEGEGKGSTFSIELNLI